ncbi:MAG: DUF1553 domain-containing protein [Bacteroidota bacterium]
MKNCIFILLAICCTTVFSCSHSQLPETVAIAYAELPKDLDFNVHVKPILSDKCFACHGPDKGKIKAGLQLHLAETAYAPLPDHPDKVAIKPGSLAKSEAFHRIFSDEPSLQMPPPEFNVPLNEYEKAVLTKWIEDGAVYQPHWAFLKAEMPKIPKVENSNFARNPIDHFILEKLEEQRLSPSQEADKALLLRRLSLDLTGLPPSIEEIEAFLADQSENAYEKQVDRLIASVHYGEKMATDWMDVARYADTYGYQVDRYRDMSPWRDWVIESFNENMPYDQFITWQLAGDLLPNASREQILATAFNRLHPQNMEGGIVDEEFRVENVSDRVAVLGDGIMALTLSCAKCHDHKYDPISQKNYYEVYSFFNNINETGQIAWDKTTPVPTLAIPTPAQAQLIEKLEHKIELAHQAVEEISLEEQAAIEQWIAKGNFEELKTPSTKALVADYRLNGNLNNQVNARQKSKMDRQFSKKETPKYVSAYKGKGLLLDGDAWLECKDVGIFKRSDPFTIGLWVNIPKNLKEGVIFHKNKGTMLHSLRGYHLNFKAGKLEWVMARTWPENAIIEHTLAEIPREEWVQLTVTYDGSSTAKGTKIFVNGAAAATRIEKDNLTRDIVFNYLEDIIYREPIEPSLQFGARWRGLGLKGGKIDQIVVYKRALTDLEVMQLANTEKVQNILKARTSDLDKSQESALEQYYLNNFSKTYNAALERLKIAQQTLVDSIENVPEIMVMKEMKHTRKTYILERGVYDSYGEQVFPNTPESVMKMPDDLPKNRLGLAQWLTHKDNPLTAKVAVNRYWQNYFGRGLVKTAQDFGNQGALPTHPELLDWLAVTFMQSGWDVKALQKMIVLSATYRQSSHASPDVLEVDQENKWLARGPSVRLTSEMIRDNALAASGLLNKEVGGESVYPYQPEGLWAMNFDPYPQDTGDALYRRSLYTMWRRTIPNPTLATFDQPERNVCTVKRQKTNTPLQALVLLNDPTFVEAAKVIGENMTRADDPKASIAEAFTRLTGKPPSQQELALLLKVRAREYEIFKQQPEKMKAWLATGEYELDPSLDQQLIAANTIVASVILNGDVAITKR